MKKTILIILISLAIIFSLAFYMSSQDDETKIINEIPKEDAQYDIVIVGAGLSGLSSAYNLNDYTVLILEKENRAVDRVLTKTQEDINYDMGAIFAYPDYIVPFAIESSELIKESGPLGLYYNDKLYFCDSVINCISQTNAMPNNDYSLKSILSSNESRDILNAFFQTIHPGEIEDYITERQEDALVKYENTRYLKGNTELVEAYQNNINAELQFNSTVTSVEDLGDKVKITYTQNDVERVIFTKSAIVTTPSYIAKKIINNISQASQEFLDNIKYAEMTVVAIGLKNNNLENFSYLITPQMTTSAIVNNYNDEKNINILLAYIADKNSKDLTNKTDLEITNEVIEILQTTLNIRENDVLFTDLVTWPQTSAVISEQMLKDIPGNYNQASTRIFLAGDYTDLSSNFPYGMSSAIKSGENVSKKIIEFLKK